MGKIDMTNVRLLFAVLSLFSATAAIGADKFATREDVESLVAKVVQAVNADQATTVAEITARDRKWVRMDLYPVIYDINGKCLAHGLNENMAGKQLIDMTDADGKPFVRDRIRLAKAKGKFWHEYKFIDPVTRKALPKSVYCEKTSELIVCAGVYQR